MSAASVRGRLARRRAVLAGYCAEQPVAVIAAPQGISVRRVAQIAAEAGVSRPRGRPHACRDLTLDAEQHNRFARWRRAYAATARTMIEQDLN
jgi:hypothetical protein